MGLEVAAFISNLVATNPVGATDPKSQGDDHIRLIKSALQASFPNIAGAATASHTELSQLHGGVLSSLGDGTAALPAYSFASDPDTGIYRFGANALGFATAGVVGFTVSNQQAQALDGAVGAPGYSFANDTNTGIYRAASDDLRLSAGGTDSFRVGVNFSQTIFQMFFPDGTAGAPAVVFNNDTNTGMYRIGTDAIAWTCGGVLQMNLSPGTLRGVDGAVGTPFYSFDADTNTGMYRRTADVVSFAANGTLVADIAVAGIDCISGVITAPVGAVGTPAFAFRTDPNTGMYNVAADIIGFAAGGVSIVDIRTDRVTVGQPIRIVDGAIGAPAYTFGNETSTGMYRVGASSMGFTVAGSLTMTLGPLTMAVSLTSTTTATAGAQTLPANPQGFIVMTINGTARKIPYYNT